MMKPSEVKFVIVEDSREQHPLVFDGYEVIRKKLDTCDYSVEGYEDAVGCERKALGDLISTIDFKNRERFCRELERMTHFQTCAIVIEANEADVLPYCHDLYRTQYRQWIAKQKRGIKCRKPMRPETRALSVFGSLKAFRADYGIHFYWLGGAGKTARWVLEFFQYFMRHKGEAK
jgi:hypothetical protein